MDELEMGSKDSAGLMSSPSESGKEGAPPAYSALFPTPTTVRQKMEDSKQEGKMFSTLPLTLCDILCQSFYCGCCYIVLAIVPIVMIIIGSVYLNDCRIQRMIPIFLIVFGCVSIAQTVFGILKMCCSICCGSDDDNRQKKSMGGNCCESLFSLFLFIWIIVGSVYVFSAWGPWNDHGSNDCQPNGNDPNCCNPVLMYFSFAVLLTIYVMSAIACCFFFCCMCCVFTCAGVSAASVKESTS